MFVRPLSAVGSAPTAVWRQWYWRTSSPPIVTRNPFRPPCVFPWTELPSSYQLRHLHHSPALMKHSDSEPPFKRRKSLESEHSGKGVQPSPKCSASRERREYTPEWLHHIRDVPLPPGILSPSPGTEVKAGEYDIYCNIVSIFIIINALKFSYRVKEAVGRAY